MNKKRPYFSKSISELEEIFENNKNNKSELKRLKIELTYRTRPKAKKLFERVEKILISDKKQKEILQPRTYSPDTLEQLQLPIFMECKPNEGKISNATSTKTNTEYKKIDNTDIKKDNNVKSNAKLVYGLILLVLILFFYILVK